ncbi:MAG: histidinol-phosphate aminotransferase family protein [SAR202 cluster bacterium]|nr:histidinol-phosphate aminotransferase family protein [SAR202 cluster bacterium]
MADMVSSNSRFSEPAAGTPSRHAANGGSPVAAPAGRPVHGGIRPADLRALGLRPEDVLDFSASISPLGPPQGVWEAMRRVDLTAYPDPSCLELREALARHLISQSPFLAARGELPLEQILAGNGSTELIHLLAREFLAGRPGRQALLLSPTYGEYAGACALADAPVKTLAARRSEGFRWDLAEAAAAITAQRPGLVFLCNPNNPTGVFLPQDYVAALAEITSKSGGILVVDEAYLGFVEQSWDTLSLLTWDNVVLLRSMTKDYALTSLRLGYLLADAGVAARLAALQPDWSVNGLAQAAGLAALADKAYLSQARQAVSQAREYLASGFSQAGFPVFPSAANFLLVQVGDAVAWRQKLMRRGLFVRDCTSFGLPDCIRVGIRPLADCQRLVAALEARG